ncbi:hypothetical protein [Microbispora rosea]|uniref:hypothetical protein n=1 Tax=Microbispora rosea TaxID=58117 RepID=UPI003425DDE1
MAALLTDCTDSTSREVIQAALNGPPEPSLPLALKSALATVRPARLIWHLRQLLQAGMPWMSDIGARRVQLLSFEHPIAGRVKLPGEDVLDGAPEWRIYHAALGHPAAVGADEIARVIPESPLSVVDDFIDLGLVGPDDEPWRLRSDEKENLYLRARLTPESLSRDEAHRLGWAELERRHAFLGGDDLVDGDDIYSLLAAFWRGETDIRLRSAVPAERRPLFDEIMLGSQTGHWPQHITKDRGLWALLAALWTPADLINAKASEFHAWRALYNSYRWMLMGWLDKAKAQVQRLTYAAAHKSEDGRPFLPDSMRAEIHNMAAYLTQETNDLERGIRLLEAVQDLHPVVAENLRRLRDRRSQLVNKRDHWENPYLMLGVPHGDPDWESQWRDLRKQLDGDVDRLTLINAAKRRLQQAERSEADFYVLPLDEQALQMPLKRSSLLLPPVEPLTRRTPPSGATEITALRDAAAQTIISDFLSVPNP